MVDRLTGADVIFLCDGKACPEDKKRNCFTQPPEDRVPNPHTLELDEPCRHTSNILHAANFREFGEGTNAYTEKLPGQK